VTYRDLIFAASVRSPDHPVWHWLSTRSGRVAGLCLQLCLGVAGIGGFGEIADDLHDWVQPLQTLSAIPSVQLRVEWVGRIANLDHPCIAQWLKQHGQLISHLTVEIDVHKERLKMKDFSEAAAPCRFIDLKIRHAHTQMVDLADLHPVTGSLQRLSCVGFKGWNGYDSLRGASAFNSMSQLTTVHLDGWDFGNEEPWDSLATLTSLQVLSVAVRACGDPAPLSALTGLSSLSLESCRKLGADVQVPFSFSSLQPLSTLQQLETLQLSGHASAATTLQGLAGLSNLKDLYIVSGKLRNLEGISSGVTSLFMAEMESPMNLAGIEGCTSMKSLGLLRCCVSSLQPLRGLTSMDDLYVTECCVTSLEGIESMSLLQSLSLYTCTSLTHLSEVKHVSALTMLEVWSCDGVTSLQPLSHLGKGLQKLSVLGCEGVQEEVLELPHVQPTAVVEVMDNSVKEVVLAGGVRKAVEDPE
jgi:hypothetical protein